MALRDNPAATRALEVARKLTPTQRIFVGAGLITALVGVWLIAGRSPEAQMSVLYTDLKAEDASAITQELAAVGTAYELRDGGATIVVPSEKVYQARLDLAGQGLPNGSDGYSLLDEQGITTSEFKQRVDFQRALEGEIASTIEAIDGVDTAVVHLALPEETVFVDNPGTPTAAVLVKSRGDLDPETVKGIAHLVASSVKGMTAENVTITDGAGRPLDQGATTSSDKIKTGFEAEMAKEVTALIGRIAGADRVHVTVTAQLNLDQTERSSESWEKPTGTRDGVDGLLQKETVANEDYNGTTPAQGGLLGPDGAPVAAGTNGEVQYTKDDAGRDFALNRVVETTKITPGAVEKLSIAVVVDDEAVSEAQAEQIAQLVGAAAGIDNARGDQVVVTRLPFDTRTADEIAKAEADRAKAQSSAELYGMLRTVLIALLGLLGLFLAYRSARKARQVVVEEIPSEEIERIVEKETISVVEVPVPVPSDPVFGAADAEPPTKRAVEELTDEKPDQVAQLLRTWISER
jgi:flagellar M-ring protein FliF